jgi:hypothetical protein
MWVQQIRLRKWRRRRRSWTICMKSSIWGQRATRLKRAIVETIKLALPQIQETGKSLQALRGIAQISAVTIAAELGNTSGKDRSCNRRFSGPILQPAYLQPHPRMPAKKNWLQRSCQRGEAS